ncbi:methyltransferase domain-containing protein [Egicoccus sp. AB-alg2]|uniref:methyltransferase domain-containing protein n=1 Tax=Egicoccus sp. AB-alg2 TaxID=3242693 RepID=UPI00359D6C5E
MAATRPHPVVEEPEEYAMASTVTAPDVALDERLFQATVGTLELFSIYLGRRLGLYEALRDHGPMTVRELAARVGIDARYAREWLEQQAVAGILGVDEPTHPADERRYALPDGHRAALLDPEDPAHVAPFADMLVGIAATLEEVVDAYRTGGGVPYHRYGTAFRQGQGAINRPAFLTDLVRTWLPAADLDERLRRAGARVADVGCGHGWAAIAVARHYPRAIVVGVDADRASVDEAREHARAAQVEVTFLAEDAKMLPARGPFDVVLVLEALHDLSHPVEVLRACRAALRTDGAVLVADEAVAERFVAPGDELERMMFGWSVSHCLPASRVEPGSAAVGTAIRPGTVRELARQAGYRGIEVVDVDGGFFRLYRLDP